MHVNLLVKCTFFLFLSATSPMTTSDAKTDVKLNFFLMNLVHTISYVYNSLHVDKSINDLVKNGSIQYCPRNYVYRYFVTNSNHYLFRPAAEG